MSKIGPHSDPDTLLIRQNLRPLRLMQQPYSRPDKLKIVDGRLAEAKLMARVRDELTEHLGGKPNPAQKILIDRAAALSLRLHLMDRESARSGVMTERNGRQYLAWNNSLSRLLNQIGLKTVVSKPQALNDYVAARPEQSPGAAA